MLKQLEATADFESMTISERLSQSALAYDFDIAMLNNKVRARQILEYLKVDSETITDIINNKIP